jgi:photosystem II stability/assembly factor-like uncharacterized protein
MTGTATDGIVTLAGAAGAILQSNDGGVSFQIVPTVGNRVYSGVTHAADGNIMLVGFGGLSFVDSMAYAMAKESGNE